MPGHWPEPHRDLARSRPALPPCSDKDSLVSRKPLKHNGFEDQTVEDGLGVPVYPRNQLHAGMRFRRFKQLFAFATAPPVCSPSWLT